MKYDKGLVGGSTVLMILSLLKEGDRYGYDIIKELEERSEKAFQFKEGTLYPVLHRLEAKGWVTSYKAKGDRGKMRKYYRITKGGAEELEEELKMWESFTENVQKVLQGNQGKSLQTIS
ncbi:PadR family transcriptional regulator [Isachenkonia alkalipeptolytica]|uniref:Helix-turn-helix transcriptional regulator n=1 Tax=Isachenkonia alkalipeptolytica TaxID=2565777 RepID=A0AA44BE32_9CLOT|nr:PadR family transcriptional regulator [Isachenkonia alkalipeptolytica]NBG87690.1 helix-turn-helix transcriptional regulator [Isachenkonia alkalipeptolytica]